MFIAGLALTLIGITLAFLGDFWFAQIVDPATMAYGAAGTIATILREITMTLGLILIGTSPLARTIEVKTPRE